MRYCVVETIFSLQASCVSEIRDVDGRLWDLLSDVDSFSGFGKYKCT